MADENAVIIGRVAVRVHPHTKDFRRQAERDLDRIEKQLRPVKVKVAVDVDDKDLQKQLDEAGKKVDQKNKGAEFKLRVNPDSLSSVNRAMAELERRIEKLGEFEYKINGKSKRELEAYLQDIKDNLWIELRVDQNSEASLERAIKQIDGELDKLREMEIRVDLDESSLKAARDELEYTLGHAQAIKLNLEHDESKRLLDRVQATLNNVSISPTLDEAAARKVKREMERLLFRKEELRAKITPDMLPADKRKVLRDIEDIDDKLKDLEDTKVDVEVELAEVSYRQTAARLLLLARDRTVKLRPVLDNFATRKVGASIAALSGARLAYNIFDDLVQSISRLDKQLPLIGSIALAIAGLGAAGITSVSNLAALSYSLAQIAAVGLALPGILGGVAIGVGVTITAFRDFNKKLPEVKKALSDFRKLISGNFWAKAQTPMREFFADILPKFRDGLDKTSTSLGTYFGALSKALKGEFNQGLGNMFADLAESITIASSGTIHLAKSMRVLGEAGASYLPRLATFMNDLAEKTANWLEQAEKSGELKDLIDLGITNLTALGRAAKDFGGILAGVGRAATAGGGSPLVTFADTMERVHRVVDSPAFQKGMTRVFTAAHKAISDITEKAGPGFKRFMGSLPGFIERVFAKAGPAIGTLLGSISDALARPAFQDGIVALFEGIGNVINDLAPVMPNIADAFGVLGKVLGDLLTAVGPSLATIFQALADALVQMGPSLSDAVKALGGAFARAMEKLAPVMPKIADALVYMLEYVADNPDVVLALATAFTALSLALPGIAALISGVSTAIGGISVATVSGVATAIGGVVISLTGFDLVKGDSIKEKLTTIKDAFEPAGNAARTLATDIKNLTDTILPDLDEALQSNGGQATTWSAVVSSAMYAASAIMEAQLTFISVNVRAATTLWDLLFRSFGTGINKFMSEQMGGLGQAIDGGLRAITALFRAATSLMKGDWSGAWEQIKLIPGAAFDGIIGTFRVVTSPLTALMSQLGINMDFTSRMTWEKVSQRYRDGISTVTKIVSTLPKRIANSFGEPGRILYDIGASIVEGLASGIRDSFDVATRIASALAGAVASAARVKLDVNSPSKVFRSIGNSVGEGMEMGIRDGIAANEKASKDLAGSVINGASGLTANLKVASTTAASTPAASPGNTYHLNVDGGGPNATADDIADALLFGIRSASLGGVYT